MSKMIQVRDVPDEVHGALKARAARSGMSLSDYVKRELQRSASRPSMEEWLAWTAQMQPIRSKRSAADVIRAMRDER